MSVDALTSSLAALQDVLDCMPAVRAMQIQLDGYADGVLRITAPLAANVNDKGNAFGGSLASVLTLSGWALVSLRLRLAGHDAEVYVADSNLRYLAPVYEDLHAHAEAAEATALASSREQIRNWIRRRISGFPRTSACHPTLWRRQRSDR